MCPPASFWPDAKVQMYLVYLKYSTLALMPLMVYPKVLFPSNFSIKKVLCSQRVKIAAKEDREKFTSLPAKLGLVR